MDDFLEISCVWERPFSMQTNYIAVFGPCEKLQEMGEGTHFNPKKDIANFAKRRKRVKGL